MPDCDPDFLRRLYIRMQWPPERNLTNREWRIVSHYDRLLRKGAFTTNTALYRCEGDLIGWNGIDPTREPQLLGRG